MFRLWAVGLGRTVYSTECASRNPHAGWKEKSISFKMGCSAVGAMTDACSVCGTQKKEAVFLVIIWKLARCCLIQVVVSSQRLLITSLNVFPLLTCFGIFYIIFQFPGMQWDLRVKRRGPGGRSGFQMWARALPSCGGLGKSLTPSHP